MHGVPGAGVGMACQDLARQEVEKEPTGTYLRRVLAGHTHPGSPPGVNKMISAEIARSKIKTGFDGPAHGCERFAVDGAGAEGLEAFEVQRGRVALVLVKAVIRIAFVHG